MGQIAASPSSISIDPRQLQKEQTAWDSKRNLQSDLESSSSIVQSVDCQNQQNEDASKTRYTVLC